MGYVADPPTCGPLLTLSPVVVVALSAKPTTQGKRLRIPTIFLTSEETVQPLATDLQSIHTEGYSRWPDGLECTKTAALQCEKKIRATSLNEPQAMLLTSSADHVSEEVWTFLKQQGYTPTSRRAAYQILTALAERLDQDRTGQMVVAKLKTALHDLHSFQPWRRRQEMWRLTKQLQFKRKLRSLRNKSGQLLPDLDSMVTELVDYWQQTMNAKEAPRLELANYL